MVTGYFYSDDGLGWDRKYLEYNSSIRTENNTE
jgi:hypothetical protein